MDFCPECGTHLYHLSTSQTMFCRKCQQEIVLSPPVMTSSVNHVASRLTECVVALNPDESQFQVLPTTRVECPKCSHDRAYYRTLEI